MEVLHKYDAGNGRFLVTFAPEGELSVPFDFMYDPSDAYADPERMELIRKFAIVEQMPPPPVQPPSRVITFKGDIWRRCTDEQGDTIDTALAQLSTRQRRLWDDAQYLDHADPLVVLMRDQMIAAFGQSETDRILAPSEV